MRPLLLTLLLAALIGGVLFFVAGRDGAAGETPPDRPEVVRPPDASELSEPHLPAATETSARVATAAERERAAPPSPNELPTVPEDTAGARAVFDATGEPFANGVIGLIRDEPSLGSAGRVKLQTDEQGVVRRGFRPGFYRASFAVQHEEALALRFVEPTFEARADEELELRLLEPTWVIEVEVVLPEGRDGVCLVTCGSPRSFARSAESRHGENVRFGVWEDELGDGIELFAKSAAGDVSERLGFERPPSFVRLELLPGGAVDVRVWQDSGEPAVEQRVQLFSRDVAGSTLPDAKATDTEGLVAFEDLLPGSVDVLVALPRGGWSHHGSVEVRRGERAAFEATLAPELPLAVAGRALGEDGQPLADRRIVVEPLGLPFYWTEDVPTDSKGRFELHAPVCDAVRVRANLDSGGDVFEPDELVVAHGTTDVVLRRTAAAEERSFEIQAVDAHTGEPLGDVIATFDRGPGSERFSNSYGARSAFTVYVLPSTRLRIGREGYVSVTLELVSELERVGDAPLRVPMEPGLRHAFRVFDMTTLEPLAGVRFHAPNGHARVSDAEGNVALDTGEWAVYAVEKDGYEPDEWDPTEYVLFDFGDLYLAPEGVVGR